MGITISSRAITVIAWAAVTIGLQALIPLADGAPGGPAASGTTAVRQAPASAATRYWTPTRMTAALRASGGDPAATRTLAAAREPVSPVRSLVEKAVPQLPAAGRPDGPWFTGNTAGDGLRWTHGGAAANAVGKIFFTLGGEDYVCSGTLVGRDDVVLTAAHCVTSGAGPDGTPEWATNWVFVPGFHDGRMPYGEYAARHFFVTPDWAGPGGGSERNDIAFVQLSAGTASPPPGLPVAFGGRPYPPRAVTAYVFGYPSLPPYTGLYPDYCAGPVTTSGSSVRTACAMTAGDSGGPWLAGFSPLSGTGQVVAVSSYKLAGNLRVLYGAMLGPRARALYERAVSPAR